MEYTIVEMKRRIHIDEKEYIGYAFMDKYNHCIIIVYGEKKRDLLIELYKEFE